MLVSAIITEIITEIGGDTDDTDLTTKMLTFFKSGLRYLPVYARDRAFLAEGTITLSAAASTASLSGLSSAFVEERAVWYVDSGSERVPIQKSANAEFFQRVYSPNGSGKPEFYRIVGTTIYFDKPADASTTIGFDYFKEISSVATSDTFFGHEQIIQAAKHFCKMVYFGDYEEDMNKGLNHERLGKELLYKFERDYEDKENGSRVYETTDY